MNPREVDSLFSFAPSVRCAPVRRWAASLSLLFALGAAADAAAQATPAPSAPSPVPAAPAPQPPAPQPPAGTFSDLLGVSGGLRAVDAARRAASTSIQASIEHQQVVAARAARQEVIWNAAPRLSLTAQTTYLSPIDPVFFDVGDGTRVPINPALRYNHLLNANLNVPLSDYVFRLARALSGAGANEEAARLEERAARATAAANAKLAYYDWARTKLESRVAAQSRAQATAQLERMQALASVGRAAEADLLQAQAFEADAELAVRQAETQEALAEERLRLAIHAPPGEALGVGEDVLAAFAPGEEAASLDALHREALQKRLEMQALEQGRQALEDAAGVEGSRALPRVDAFGNYTYANPNQRIFPQEERWKGTWDIGLRATWALNDLGTSDAHATTVRSQLAELVERRSGLEESVRLEVLGALRALHQARASIATAEQGERAAQAAYEARERLQAQGMATALELMQAETARTRARLAVINAHIGLRVARAQLDHAVGRDIAELGAPQSRD